MQYSYIKCWGFVCLFLFFQNNRLRMLQVMMQRFLFLIKDLGLAVQMQAKCT